MSESEVQEQWYAVVYTNHPEGEIPSDEEVENLKFDEYGENAFSYEVSDAYIPDALKHALDMLSKGTENVKNGIAELTDAQIETIRELSQHTPVDHERRKRAEEAGLHVAPDDLRERLAWHYDNLIGKYKENLRNVPLNGAIIKARSEDVAADMLDEIYEYPQERKMHIVIS